MAAKQQTKTPNQRCMMKNIPQQRQINEKKQRVPQSSFTPPLASRYTTTMFGLETQRKYQSQLFHKHLNQYLPP